EEPPAQIQDYLESSQWKLHDEAGSQEVRLTRTFGSEEIEISFSVADISNLAENQMGDPDTAYGDEYMEGESAQSGGANTKGSINQGRTSGGNIKVAPEDRVAPADRPELEDEDGFYDDDEATGSNFPVRLLIKVTRRGQSGALEIEAVASDGDVLVENVFFYASADMADPTTSEGEYRRRLVYGGPRYDNLDPDLQALMDQFLAERGINTELSNWLPDFVDWKEQKEYIRWLNNVKNFLS
ncbi:MAG: hypothetical protein INR71_09430, partial [Terriglobus roseus]|nr:hypothetical protein [Terriglobus roseus]